MDDNQATRLKTDERTRQRANPLLVSPKHAQCVVKLVGIDVLLFVLVRRSHGKDECRELLLHGSRRLGRRLVVVKSREDSSNLFAASSGSCSCSNMKRLQ